MRFNQSREPMHKLQYEKSVCVPVEAGHLWQWHQQAGAFERLSPAWQRIRPVRLQGPEADGCEVSFYLEKGPFSKLWRASISEVEPPYRFVDKQLEGPFRYWCHEHLMTEAGSGRSRLTDRVEYALPFGLGRLPPARGFSSRELERLFKFRHRRMLLDLERHKEGFPGTGKTVLVTGSTGLIGRRLVPYLQTLGYEVRGLTRGPARGNLFHWDPEGGSIGQAALAGVDAVIHLAGENIASGRWTAERKERILRSRVQGTRTIVEAMREAVPAPKVLVCASGVNYYGSGTGPKDEASPQGSGFLAEVCRHWEAEAMRANDAGIRTVCLRTGVVLDPLGGALAKMLPAFRLGLGGPIGSGRQGFPWIGMDDLLDIYERALGEEAFSGPVNAVHPELASQRDFSRILGGVLRRPAALPVPEWFIRLAFGEMGREALLADLQIQPSFLLGQGHAFRETSLAATLSFLLGKGA
jgi:uncharacterized protein (TIGR01777 family)